MDIEILLTSDKAKIPTHATLYSAGYDLYAVEPGTIAPLERKLIKTNVCMAIPIGYYGRIAPRSGTALKNGIDVLAGVIDSDYRDEIGVILYNSDKSNYFDYGTEKAIAQIIIEKCQDVSWVKKDKLTATIRGNNGYGHSSA